MKKIEVIDEDDIKIEYGNLEGVSTKLTEEEKERRIKKFES